MADVIVVPTDVPTIAEAVAFAGPGDEVRVLQGTYDEWGINLRGGIVVRSQSGSSVTWIDGRSLGPVFTCRDQDLGLAAVVEGFTIRSGKALGVESGGWGGGLQCIRSKVVVRDCVIEDCEAVYGGGVGADSGVLELVDCSLRRNDGSTGGGVFAWQSQLALMRCEVVDCEAGAGRGGGIHAQRAGVSIETCVVARNRTVVVGEVTGLDLVTAIGHVTGCTIVDNFGWRDDDGALGIVDGSTIDVVGTLIANNRGTAMRCWESQITVRCCDMFGNSAGDALCGEDLGGNFSQDPLFCDLEGGDYRLQEQSPCLPGHHPEGVNCGLIGVLDGGCDVTPIELSSWGRIKELYRP
jgi:hypothetical protein